MSTYTKFFWVRIEVQTGKRGVDKAKVLLWQDMSWAVRTKWDWYFKYRCALEQVRHPRASVEMTWGTSDADNRTIMKVDADNISTQKGKVTKIKNRMFQARANWGEFMPIEEHPDYKRAVEKLRHEESELSRLVSEYEQKYPNQPMP